MITFLLFLIALLTLGIVASRWGAKSSDEIESPEWERRQNWPGFH